ncbi:MAG: HK97 family phage prohead protease, partial [Acidimicrobiales bacterium]
VRSLPFTDAECRVDTGSGAGWTFRGYASVFDSPYTIQDEYGEYRETVKPTAFDRSLAQGADCVFLIGHTGAPLARTKSGTLTLSADKRGLLSEAKLDPANPRAQELKSMVDRGDMDQMSFSFRDLLPTWNSDYTERNLRTVELNHGDVSAVAFGANDATAGTVAMRSRFYEAEVRAKYNAAQLKALKAKGHTLPGTTSYPIDDLEDLKNAIHAVGRGGASHNMIRSYIIGRAKAMGLSHLIPDNWAPDGHLTGSNALVIGGEHRGPVWIACNCCPPCPGGTCDGSCCPACPGDLLSQAVQAITASDSMDAPSLEQLGALNDLEARLCILRARRRAAEGPPLSKAEKLARDVAWADEIVERRRRQLARIRKGN